MTVKNNDAFIKAHPEIAKDYHDLDWLNKYVDYDNGRVKEQWERNSNGVLVNVTEREQLKEELAKAKEELEKLKGGSLHV